MDLKLKNLTLAGYKSIDSEGQSIEFGDITVLIGANGSGKSNLVSFFSMLNYMMTDALQRFIAESGYANSLLYFGAKRTGRMKANLLFQDQSNQEMKDYYSFELSHAASDTLIFANEEIKYQLPKYNNPKRILFDVGQKESSLISKSQAGDKPAKIIMNLLKQCQVFQFHDTSSKSNIRLKTLLNDEYFLFSDGGNLSAFLYAMQNNAEYKKYYDRIIRHIQRILPQFKDFDLAPPPMNERVNSLQWKAVNSNYSFSPHQLSDGSLRFMALATLLLQPPKTLPNVVIIDEPELGLHPAAITELAGMVRTASKNCQIILATQSPRLVDEFDVDDIVVVERDELKQCTTFKKLDAQSLNDWLKDYSLSELWEKNVLGGQP